MRHVARSAVLLISQIIQFRAKAVGNHRHTYTYDMAFKRIKLSIDIQAFVLTAHFFRFNCVFIFSSIIDGVVLSKTVNPCTYSFVLQRKTFEIKFSF